MALFACSAYIIPIYTVKCWGIVSVCLRVFQSLFSDKTIASTLSFYLLITSFGAGDGEREVFMFTQSEIHNALSDAIRQYQGWHDIVYGKIKHMEVGIKKMDEVSVNQMNVLLKVKVLADATFDDGMLGIPRLRTEPITAYIDADAAIELLMEANHKLKLQATITSAKLDYIDMDGMKIDSNNISYE